MRLRVSEGSFNSLTPSVHENLSSYLVICFCITGLLLLIGPQKAKDKAEATHQTATSLEVRISGWDDVLSAQFLDSLIFAI